MQFRQRALVLGILDSAGRLRDGVDRHGEADDVLADVVVEVLRQCNAGRLLCVDEASSQLPGARVAGSQRRLSRQEHLLDQAPLTPMSQ